MDQQIQTGKSTIIKKVALLIVIIILMAGAFFVGEYYGKAKDQAANKIARDNIVKEIFGDASMLATNSLSGKITSIAPDGKSIIVEVSSVFNVNLPNEYQQKNVLVNGDTKIVLLTQKDPQTLAEEMKEFQAQIKPGKPITTPPPSPTIQTEIKISDLKAGDNVNFSFAPDPNVNILNSQFTATNISVSK